jgi:LacI family gluconate utilization system Gnt-I transcriptional repressor
MLANARLPIVELWDLPDAPIDAAVGFSNRAAGAAMTRLLVELGYRKIAFVGAFGEGDRRGQLRCAGYESVLSEFSLGPARRVATEAGPTWWSQELRPPLPRWNAGPIRMLSSAQAMPLPSER